MSSVEKIKSVQEMMALRPAMQQRGQRLVFTNGCFELLHVGHVRYLQAARALGDALIVGLNSDASVLALKGRARLLVPQAERAELLAALAAVDYVVIFEAPTAENLVATLRPDVYVKGGDYRAGAAPEAGGLKTAPEMAIVQAYGGRVAVLPFSAGHSTTGLIERIRRGETLEI